jgi:hypothetical protein
MKVLETARPGSITIVSRFIDDEICVTLRNLRIQSGRIQTQEGIMKYVDGYVLPVPKKNLPAYRRMAQEAGKVWRKHGALEFCECAGDDLKTQKIKSFPNWLSRNAARQ